MRGSCQWVRKLVRMAAFIFLIGMIVIIVIRMHEETLQELIVSGVAFIDFAIRKLRGRPSLILHQIRMKCFSSIWGIQIFISERMRRGF